MLELATGSVRLSFRARSQPIGLSVYRGRVSWAENVRGTGFVRSADVS